jgi:hypothetical protein
MLDNYKRATAHLDKFVTRLCYPCKAYTGSVLINKTTTTFTTEIIETEEEQGENE